jgi:hypothetical protein
VVLGHIGRLQFRENGNLLNDVVHFIFGVFDVDYLDGNGLSSTPINSKSAEEDDRLADLP